MKKLFKISRILSICLLLLTGINGIIAGILFIVDPTGKKMGMSTSYLSNSPFLNYLIPGITLLIVNGLMNVIVAILTIRKRKYYASLIIVQGLLLSGWIIIQVILVRDFNGLHFSMLSISVALITLGVILRGAFKSLDHNSNLHANSNFYIHKTQDK
ncbi:hypothetical protein SanaruYs_20000 [Chryseotalea sanaruensis]|uniref:DUF4293 domain-containing protein n=1 Tax=Chryseotalea sanaruensis TaxID=2482724 RepID=A0A401UA67_9BACT|nr:hypothetical protein [Chryseotalea sanaruensis]GCC51771.1 hypothetical protein SanaruYs_20000 [Chryseotalea sanaruensis]